MDSVVFIFNYLFDFDIGLLISVGLMTVSWNNFLLNMIHRNTIVFCSWRLLDPTSSLFGLLRTRNAIEPQLILQYLKGLAILQCLKVWWLSTHIIIESFSQIMGLKDFKNRIKVSVLKDHNAMSITCDQFNL